MSMILGRSRRPEFEPCPTVVPSVPPSRVRKRKLVIVIAFCAVLVVGMATFIVIRTLSPTCPSSGHEQVNPATNSRSGRSPSAGSRGLSAAWG